MARNKYPEETVELILKVSIRLFIEKGYEKTSIQDIIDNLGGLSKGAIYHHFKSKEDIFLTIYNRLSAEIGKEMIAILNSKTLTGAEKLQKMVFSSLDTPVHSQIFSVSPNFLSNPRFLSVHMKMAIEEIIPKYIEPAIIEAAADGSIKTDYPKELAQVFILMTNIWLNPLLYPMKEDDIENKIAFFIQTLKGMGIDFLETESIQNRLKELKKLVANR
ncbi:MAG: TetR/AcrR family transcriptional regulator [Spirochaetales bacterium]|nr:TetR/AcrR family transcriptional regulator [Spirochaetales bacterium]